MSDPQRPATSRSIPGWMLVLIGIGILAVWAIILLVVAAAGLPLSADRRTGGLLLLLTPLVGVVVIVVGLVAAILRKPLRLTGRTLGSPSIARYGTLGPQIRAAERAARAERRRLRAEKRRTGGVEPSEQPER